MRRTSAGDVLARKYDIAGVGPVEAADHVEERGLARAVRANNRDQLAGADRERNRLYRPHAAKVLRDARDGELRLSGRDLAAVHIT